jgi:Replication-relaxation
MTPLSDEHGYKPFILNSKEERILEVSRNVTYVTAPDIKHLVYPEASLSTVQRVLTKLAGGQDKVLYRFSMPSTTRGMKQYCYTLSTKGRELLGVEGYYPPYKLRALSYSHIRHHLSLTRFVCSALVWCRSHPQVRLADIRLCYELARELGKAAAENDGQPAPVLVVPDGWLHFEFIDAENGDHKSYLPLWLEIDRGTEFRIRFQQHVADRIEFIRSDQYTQFFGAEAVRIAYATLGSRDALLSSRRAAMRSWTAEVLKDLALESWNNVFYFTTLVYEDIYNLKHFSDPVWYSPGDPKPKRLLEPNRHKQACSQASMESVHGQCETDTNCCRENHRRDTNVSVEAMV